MPVIGCGVDQCEAMFERGTDSRDRLLVADGPVEISKPRAAETDGRELLTDGHRQMR